LNHKLNSVYAECFLQKKERKFFKEMEWEEDFTLQENFNENKENIERVSKNHRK